MFIKYGQNKDFKGVTIDGEAYKISQLADDTSLLLDWTDKTSNNTLGLLHTFVLIFGHKISYRRQNKTNMDSLPQIKYSIN